MMNSKELADALGISQAAIYKKWTGILKDRLLAFKDTNGEWNFDESAPEYLKSHYEIGKSGRKKSTFAWIIGVKYSKGVRFLKLCPGLHGTMPEIFSVQYDEKEKYSFETAFQSVVEFAKDNGFETIYYDYEGIKRIIDVKAYRKFLENKKTVKSGFYDKPLAVPYEF